MNAEPTTAPPAPLIENEPVEVAEGVYVIPDGRVPLVPNVGIVRRHRAARSSSTPAWASERREPCRRHAERLAGGQPLFLTLTHFHPEHGYGAQAFADGAVIVYNREQPDELRQKGAGYLELFKTFGDTVAEQLEGVELVEPHVVYDGARRARPRRAHRAAPHLRARAHARRPGRVPAGAAHPLRRRPRRGKGCFAIFPYFPPDDVDVDGDRWIAVLEELERLEPADRRPRPRRGRRTSR